MNWFKNTQNVRIYSAKNYQDQSLFEYVFDDKNTLSIISDSVILCTCKSNYIYNVYNDDISNNCCIHIQKLIDTFNKNKTVNDLLQMHKMYLKDKVNNNEENEYNCAICFENIEYKCVKCKECNIVLHKSCFLLWLTGSIISDANCIVCKSPVYSVDLKNSF
jgi:uncharacterized protein (DUF2235 family)